MIHRHPPHPASLPEATSSSYSPIRPGSSAPTTPAATSLATAAPTYLQRTLERIDEIANQDVEMQAPVSEASGFLVVDTNIVLHHFEVLRQFVEDVERFELPAVVVVPGTVIFELDSQKNREGLAWLARRASGWLLDKVKEKKTVKVQAHEETCKSTGSWKKREPGETRSEMDNDLLILDCCLYFSRIRPTALCSADVNLCLACSAQGEYGIKACLYEGYEINIQELYRTGLATITPKSNWSSRELSKAVWGDSVDLSRFGGYSKSYKQPTQVTKEMPSGTSKTVAAVPEDEGDVMMIDDDASQEELPPSHALDLLHLQVVEYFCRLLMDLVGRMGGDEVRRRTRPEDEVNMSQHAPRLRPYTEWSVREWVEWLWQRRGSHVPIAEHPRLDLFLSRPYQRGTRRGQDWTRREWELALEKLVGLGLAWEDGNIVESVSVLHQHVAHIFRQKLRPT